MTTAVRYFALVDGCLYTGQPRTGFVSAGAVHAYMARKSMLPIDRYTVTTKPTTVPAEHSEDLTASQREEVARD